MVICNLLQQEANRVLGHGNALLQIIHFSGSFFDSLKPNNNYFLLLFLTGIVGLFETFCSNILFFFYREVQKDVKIRGINMI